MDDDGGDDLEKSIALIILEVTANSKSVRKDQNNAVFLKKKNNNQRDTGVIIEKHCFQLSLI